MYKHKCVDIYRMHRETVTAGAVRVETIESTSTVDMER